KRPRGDTRSNDLRGARRRVEKAQCRTQDRARKDTGRYRSTTGANVHRVGRPRDVRVGRSRLLPRVASGRIAANRLREIARRADTNEDQLTVLHELVVRLVVMYVLIPDSVVNPKRRNQETSLPPRRKARQVSEEKNTLS